MKKIFLLILLVTAAAMGKVRVVTSTTDLAWAAKEIGGELVDVKSLTRGNENPHYVDTLPGYIRQVADADVVCSVGLELEVGWIPKILARSGNSKVQPGGKGFCEVGGAVTVLEKPSGAIDRSMGDVHPAGNPHFWLSPLHFAQGSKAIVEALVRVDPFNQAGYEAGGKRFTEKMKSFHAEQKKKLAARLVGKPKVLEYHKEFTYLFDAYGIESVGSLEEKPGVAPSAGRIASMATAANKAGAKALLAASYSPQKTLEKFHELSGVPVIVVATSLPMGADYYTEHAAAIDALVKALGAPLVGTSK